MITQLEDLLDHVLEIVSDESHIESVWRMEDVYSQVHTYSNEFGWWEILEENFEIWHAFITLTIELKYKFNVQKIGTWALKNRN